MKISGIFSQSLEEWLESFFETPTFKAAIQNVQQHFNLGMDILLSKYCCIIEAMTLDYWKLEAKDLLTLYDICIHEMNLLGRSRFVWIYSSVVLSCQPRGMRNHPIFIIIISWCDLFDTEQLSALQYYTDLRTYWTKGIIIIIIITIILILVPTLY